MKDQPKGGIDTDAAIALLASTKTRIRAISLSLHELYHELENVENGVFHDTNGRSIKDPQEEETISREDLMQFLQRFREWWKYNGLQILLLAAAVFGLWRMKVIPF